MSTGARRLFVALWPTDELRRGIEQATLSAVQRSGGRVIPPDNFHITLAFMGSVPETRILDVARCVLDTKIEPFELLLGRLSWWERPALLCLEPIAAAQVLGELVNRLRINLQRQDFAVDHRSYRPHLTLAREVRQELASDSIGKLIREMRWQVQRMELLESKPLTVGSSYTVLPT